MKKTRRGQPRREPSRRKALRPKFTERDKRELAQVIRRVLSAQKIKFHQKDITTLVNRMSPKIAAKILHASKTPARTPKKSAKGGTTVHVTQVVGGEKTRTARKTSAKQPSFSKKSTKPARPLRVKKPRITPTKTPPSPKPFHLPIVTRVPTRQGKMGGVALVFEQAIRAHNSLYNPPSTLLPDLERRKNKTLQEITEAELAAAKFARRQMGATALADKIRKWKVPLVKQAFAKYFDLRSARNVTLQGRETAVKKSLEDYRDKIQAEYDANLKVAQQRYGEQHQGQLAQAQNYFSTRLPEVHQYFEGELNQVRRNRLFMLEMQNLDPNASQKMNIIADRVRRLNDPNKIFHFEIWYRWMYGYLAMEDYKSANTCLSNLNYITQ